MRCEKRRTRRRKGTGATVSHRCGEEGEVTIWCLASVLTKRGINRVKQAYLFLTRVKIFAFRLHGADRDRYWNRIVLKRVKSGAFSKRYGFVVRVNGEISSIWKRNETKPKRLVIFWTILKYYKPEISPKSTRTVPDCCQPIRKLNKHSRADRKTSRDLVLTVMRHKT